MNIPAPLRADDPITDEWRLVFDASPDLQRAFKDCDSQGFRRWTRLHGEREYEGRAPIATSPHPTNGNDVVSSSVPSGVGVVLNPDLRCGIREHTQYFLTHATTRHVAMSQDPSATDLSELLRESKSKNLRVLHIEHEFSLFRKGDALTQLMSDAKATGVKVIFDCHTGPDGDVQRDALRSWASLAAKVIVHSEWTRDALKDFSPTSIPLAVPDDILWHVSLDSWIATGTPLVGTFGFPNKHKGFSELAQAAGAIARRVPGAKVVFIAHPNNPKQEAYLQKVRQLPAHTVFIDEYLPVSAVVRTLAACDVLVLPYRVDVPSQSGAVETALSAGRPTVLSKSSMFAHVPETVRAKEFRVDEAPIDIAITLAEALQTNRTLDCVRAARQHLIGRRASTIAKSYDAIYAELLC